MANAPLFSIILLHYNQPSYVKIALDSIFAQDYENIELIFADDCSTKIDVDDLKNYCESKKGDNISDIKWQINEKNLGTVKSLSNAVKKATGKYLLFFAADDALFDSRVISNFVNAFSQARDDVYMISSQCTMMSVDFKKVLEVFVDPNEGDEFNSLSAAEQFKLLATDCFLAIGATAMRMDMFEKFGAFNEEYKFIEDWSYFLNLTRRGGRIEYRNFDGLLHRDGGVSHYNPNKKLPKHVIAYRYDLVRIMENEIFPFIDNFTFQEKLDVLYFYDIHLRNYKDTGEHRKTFSNFRFLKLLGKVFIKFKIRKCLDFMRIYLKRTLLVFTNSFFFWASLTVLEDKLSIPWLDSILKVVNNYILPAIVLISALFLIVSLALLVLLKFKKTLNAMRDK